MKKLIHAFAILVLLVGGVFLMQGEAESSVCTGCTCEEWCFHEYYYCLEQGGNQSWCDSDYWECLSGCQ